MNESEIGGALGIGLFLILAFVGFLVLLATIAANWKIYTKAGKPGWAAIVPIYNIIVFLEIIGRPVWWIVLFLLPIANVIVVFIVNIDLAKAFGKGTVFGVVLNVLLAPIGQLMIGFSDAKYTAPERKE